MTLRVADCYGFAGAFTLAAVQAGFELVAKVEDASKGGFGVINCEVNRHLLGSEWRTQLDEPDKWEPVDAELVIGNPPCAGFSLLSRSDYRGIHSPANACMWNLIRYASKIAPQIVIFESVQQAFQSGVELMRMLREELEKLTGFQYGLWHVLQNNYSLGGVTHRKRYFFVCSRIPFGVESMDLKNLPVMRDLFLDLEPLGDTMEYQPYRSFPSQWARQMRESRGEVDGHATVKSPHIQRALDLLSGTHWAEGEALRDVMLRHEELHGDVPQSWYYESRKHGKPKIEVLRETDFALGHNQLKRWYWRRPGYVITGGGLHLTLHPRLPRTITHREAARIQGFPDTWHILPMKDVGGLHAMWGKGIPVHAGRWVATWARESIEGRPGSNTGELMGEREWKIDVTNDWKNA